MAKQPDWTDAERLVIVRGYLTTTNEELLRLLPGRSWCGIQSMAGKLGVLRRKSRGSGKRTANPWTDPEIATLHAHYRSATADELLTLLPDRTWDAIYVRGRGLGYIRNGDVRLHSVSGKSVIGHLSEGERYYLAGILDGEGCINFQKHREPKDATALVPYTVNITVAMTSKPVIDWIDARIPGRVYREDRGNPKWLVQYRWVLRGILRSRIFCHEIAPYLIVKREQAELMAVGWLHLSNEGRAASHRRVRDLKRQQY